MTLMSKFGVSDSPGLWVALSMSLLLAACGGDGGSAATTPASLVSSSVPVSSASLARQCQSPRAASAIDPATGTAYGDRQGTLDSEKAWIHAYVNETYLWYADVPTIDPSLYVIGASVNIITPSTNVGSLKLLTDHDDVVDAYFNSQRSPLFAASGKPKDQFHFTYTTAAWNALSQNNVEPGFGFHVVVIAGSPPRDNRISAVDANSTAAQNGLARGATFISVNGVDVTDGSDVATLNEGLFSPVAGRAYTFVVQDAGSDSPRSVTMTAADYVASSVSLANTLPVPNQRVGYVVFNDHQAPAEAGLVAAISSLQAANGGAGISDLVLDMRYNGGGYLDIASELAYMIAGNGATQGKIFDQRTYNDKNPFGLTAAQSITPFISSTVGLSVTAGTPLPQLGLSKVYVLSTSATCSASEAVINGLLGVGVDVIQIGGTTCGKPYGFYAQDNCGMTYFTIQFKGVNQLGFGDYAAGFIPDGPGVTANHLPGCTVADDFGHALGDVSEGLLAAALQYRATGACPASTPTLHHAAHADGPGTLAPPPRPWKENRIDRYRTIN